jgi:RNA ligase (TIGR02306 family)
MRNLATIRKIDELLPIEGADLIQLAKIDGWQAVVKKGEFNIGELCIYCEVDSFLPDGNPAWQHLVDKSSRTFEGQKGHKLKTIKLRGELSQGFVCALSVLGPREDVFSIGAGCIGADVTNDLGIKKWEAVIPSELAGQVRGNFPTFISKTDQERCQNIGNEIFSTLDAQYEVSLKLDGTSFTGYYNNGVTGVCSRNWDLTVDNTNAGNSLFRMFTDSGLQITLASLGQNYAVQGELMGPGIQKNREGLTKIKLYIFDIYDIDNATYLEPEARQEFVKTMHVHGLNKDMVEHIPIIAYTAKLYDTLGIQNVSELLKFAEGPSINHPVREGLVFKRIDGKYSFKSISNAYLLKEKD